MWQWSLQENQMGVVIFTGKCTQSANTANGWVMTSKRYLKEYLLLAVFDDSGIMFGLRNNKYIGIYVRLH